MLQYIKALHSIEALNILKHIDTLQITYWHFSDKNEKCITLTIVNEATLVCVLVVRVSETVPCAIPFCKGSNPK